ncbi:sugar phosphate isomerase/epimerase [Maribacter sp. PR1]|uniref:Sugar phosphate isomerase/epimerase n=1 Tax=Maribacter cobaltidurans TaxID=1178778 RepID=A0ABU7IYS7_9FLAO|nr:MULTISPECIES: sugar phosphate isomerase/epimerase [Maribacter]MDC6390281.1 sugar phosphate isomerase/epimerase [Maribacter sp. PR1]MEE1977671.1 sugar phosphate isomerase/epimerase [Maribacter cobaltidurans]
MKRRDFLVRSSLLTAGTALLPSYGFAMETEQKFGVQLYSFRDQMAKDPLGTLEAIASIGLKEIESAKSSKGHYYGLTPKSMKQACEDLGMKLVSGHVHLDQDFEKTMEEAAASGQDYLICSSMPSNGQTVDNYKKVAEEFNKAGEACEKLGIHFGYHNHEYEFESDQGQVLYDILMDNTEPDLVHMELDLGWVIVAGKDPLDYFKRYPGRFPLWHLKDMNMAEKESTEFGKGGLDIKAMMNNQEASGVKHILIEQEEYASTPLESMKHNMEFLKQL